MISKEQKKEIVKDLSDKLLKQKAVVFFDYNGLDVNGFQELRKELKERGVECQACKKTLIDLSLKKAGLKGARVKDFPGQIALVLGYEDEVAPARTLYNFSKDNEQVKILSGFVQDDYLENEAILNLAKLPSRQELLAKIINSFISPISGLANTLNGNSIKLTNILRNIKAKA